MFRGEYITVSWHTTASCALSRNVISEQNILSHKQVAVLSESQLALFVYAHVYVFLCSYELKFFAKVSFKCFQVALDEIADTLCSLPSLTADGVAEYHEIHGLKLL